MFLPTHLQRSIFRNLISSLGHAFFTRKHKPSHNESLCFCVAFNQPPVYKELVNTTSCHIKSGHLFRNINAQCA